MSKNESDAASRHVFYAGVKLAQIANLVRSGRFRSKNGLVKTSRKRNAIPERYAVRGGVSRFAVRVYR